MPILILLKCLRPIEERFNNDDSFDGDLEMPWRDTGWLSRLCGWVPPINAVNMRAR